MSKTNEKAQKTPSTTGNQLSSDLGNHGSRQSTIDPKNIPPPEQVEIWVKKDLEAAHYFLGLLLQYPEVIKTAAAQIHAHVMAKENGSAIDHVTNPE